MKKTFIFCLIILNELLAQSLPIENQNLQKAKEMMKTLNVSDDQARQILRDPSKIPSSLEPNNERLEELNDESLRIEKESMQIQSLDKAINELENLDLETNESDISDVDTDEVDKEFDETSQIISYPDTNTFFGYNIFNENPEIFQESISESVDPDYTIGPGDEIILMVWGETEFQNRYIVTNDGYLFIDNIGQIFVNGLTLQKLEKKLFKQLKKVYSSLDPISGSAATYFDVSLGSLVLRPKRVFALGEVRQPGAYNVKKTTSLFTSLYYFNGPTINGSLREINLMRKGKKIKTIDFYNYLLEGKQIDDEKLLRDDVVFIPIRGKTVSVMGEIRRPMIYELKDEETLQDLIKIAGGLNNTTYHKRIQITRIIPNDKRDELGMDRTIVDVDLDKILNSKEKFLLHDGDEIQFFKISDEKQNFVSITGPVLRPGVYDVGDGLNLKDLIEKADGLMGDVYMKRVDITRQNKDRTLTHIDVRLDHAIRGDINHNILLQPSDQIVLYTHSQMLYKDDVSIDGHVINPGNKPFKKNMTVSDLIFFGGGFENIEHLNDTHLDKAELIRWDEEKLSQEIRFFRLDSVLVGKGIAELKLKMGDHIKIYSKLDITDQLDKVVSINGFVKRPGSYTLFNGMRIKDLFFVAGGFQDTLHLSKIFLKRADLKRYNEDLKTKKIIPFNLGQILSNDNPDNNFALREEDEIFIYSKEMFSNYGTVTINGDINSPGTYSMSEKMTLQNLILEAGGVQPDIYRFRAEISRIDPKNMDEEKFSESIEFMIENNENILDILNSKINKGLNFNLKPYDVVFIRKDPLFVKQETVTVIGNVYYPGEYVITNAKELVTDILERAGGLNSLAYPEASRFIRNGETINLDFVKMIRNPRSKSNFTVIPGDLIEINGRTNLVKVLGTVNSPGNYQYVKGYKMNDYVKMAGGYAKDASIFSSFVTRPDGRSIKAGLFKLSPNVIDGSVITIGRKEEVEPINLTQYASNLTQIYADITQAYLLVVLARQ